MNCCLKGGFLGAFKRLFPPIFLKKKTDLSSQKNHVKLPWKKTKRGGVKTSSNFPNKIPLKFPEFLISNILFVWQHKKHVSIIKCMLNFHDHF
jgi:hypothetical protein